MNRSDGRKRAGPVAARRRDLRHVGHVRRVAARAPAGRRPASSLARISLAAVFLTIPAIVSLRGRWGLLRASARMIVAFGLVAIAACQVTYFNAVSRLSVGVALLLEYLGVILIVAWLWLRHGQRPRRLTLIGSAAAIVGLGLVLNLTSSHQLDPIGVAWAVAAAVGLAIFFMLSADADEPLPPIALAWAGIDRRRGRPGRRRR